MPRRLHAAVEWEGASVLAVKSPFRIDATRPARLPRGIAGLAVAEMGHVLGRGRWRGRSSARWVRGSPSWRTPTDWICTVEGAVRGGLRGLGGLGLFRVQFKEPLEGQCKLVKTRRRRPDGCGHRQRRRGDREYGPQASAGRVGVDAAGLFRPGARGPSPSAHRDTATPALGLATACLCVQRPNMLRAGLPRPVRSSGEPPQIDIAWADLISG